MSDEPNKADPQPATNVGVQVMGAADNGFLGLTGWMRSLANFSAVVIGMGCFLWLLHIFIVDGRADRLADRQMFLDSVHELRSEADRHTGELKGAMDGNTQVMRDLIAEIKSAKHEGRVVPQSALPKPASPMGP